MVALALTGTGPAKNGAAIIARQGILIPTSHTEPVELVILAAMDSEITPFLDRAGGVAAPIRHGHSITRAGLLNGRRTLFVRGGIGMVNAAAATTAALISAHLAFPDAPRPLVISAGSAGGLGDEVRVGDVAVGLVSCNADADVRALGYERGQVPGMPAFFAVSAHLADIVERGLPTERRAKTVHRGLVVSSYAFVGPERALSIREHFPAALATDMESSAIAQVCHSHGAPMLAIRGISDLCRPVSDEFVAHVDDAAERSAEVAAAIAQTWSIGAGN